MGVSIRDLVKGHDVALEDLNGRVVVVDSFNMLYQFITTIRMSDGAPLMDSKGNITSHLQGLFLRTTKMLNAGIKPAFVFDGEPPELKLKERERRASLKADANKLYQEAVKQEDIESMKKYAGRTAKLTPEMVDEAKKLIRLLGCPVIQAPSEGEAQAALMVKNGDAYATVSQDFDSLVFGSDRVLRNLSLLGRRKKAGVLGYTTIKPELVKLGEVLNSIGLDHEQFVILAIMVGTDYNIGGIKGIGPKKAISALKAHGKDYEKLFKELNWTDYFDFDWKEVFYTFRNMKTTEDYNLEFKDIDNDGVKQFLVEEHDFSVAQVERSTKSLKTAPADQKSLFDF
ncbi:flap endonuclease-1 [Candidatus Woesearchaeota archaeon]|nr:flap endonuclease-1 [Candidatus Woesearchaeota archaeon]